MAARERIAHGEIYVEVNDEQARAALKQIDKDFERTMRDISREEATVTVDGQIAPFEDKINKVKRQIKAAEGQKASIRVGGNTKEVDKVLRNLRRKLKRLEGDKAVIEMDVKGDERVQKAIAAVQKAEEKRAAAFEKAEARRQKIFETMRRREEQAEAARVRRVRSDAALSARWNKQREAEMASAHAWALRLNRDMDLAAQRRQQEARDVPRLQKKYADLEQTVARLNRERNKARTMASPALQQQVGLREADALAEMQLLRAKLSAMGARPIDQKINLDINEQGVGMLGRWISAITETTVRVGPLTTTIAGLSKGLLLLGPILAGVVGHLGALAAAMGAGIAGAAGVGAGALAAFGLSLGGVGFLLPSLLRDFRNLNQLQTAYHKQVLKTGKDSEKAKEKLAEFNNALKTVAPTTRAAFSTLDKLQTRWRNMSKQARPDFFAGFEATMDTLNHQFDWFERNTLSAFHNVRLGWDEWMQGLRSREADRILRQLGDNGNASIQPLMKALGNLATWFGRVSASFSRHLPSLMNGFERWSGAMADSAGKTERLDGRVDRLVDSMRSFGHFVQAVGRWVVALFAPGVDVGTKSLEKYAQGLNESAEAMRTNKRENIADFFRKATNTSEKFFQAIKPLAAMFWEWTTIMQPFTNVALSVLGVLGDILATLLAFGPTKLLLQTVFGVFLVGGLIKRIASAGSGLWSIARALAAIKAAGGVGAALKGGAIRFLTGGLRGQTPATPMYVMNVGPGGGVPGRGGRPGGGPTAVGGLGRLATIGRLATGVGAVTVALGGLHSVLNKISDKRAAEKNAKGLEKLVSERNIQGIKRLQEEYRKFGKTPPPNLQKAIDQIKRLNDMDASKLANNVRQNWDAMRAKSNVTFKDIKEFASSSFNTIKNNTKKRSAEAERAVTTNFRQAARSIREAIRDGKVSSREGNAEIKRLWADTLTEFGFSKRQARNIAKGNALHGGNENTGGGGGAAHGGLWTIGGKAGVPAPDNVPANLGGVRATVANGEQIAVFNRHQQKAMGGLVPGGLEGFFGQRWAPHMATGGLVGRAYAKGGIVPVPGFPGESAAASVVGLITQIARRFQLVLTDAFGQGHSSPGHTQTGTAADFSGPDANMDRAVRYLVKQGYLVGYDGRFGSQDWPGHGPSTRTSNYHLHVELGGKGGSGGGFDAMLKDIKAPKAVQGRGVVTSAVQAGLNSATAVANESLSRVADSMAAPVEGGGGGVGGGAAASRSQMVRWARMGLVAEGLEASASNVAKILTLAMKESSWIVKSLNTWDSNAKAGNPSGGLMHVTIDKVGGSMERLFNPVENIRASIRYQLSRYGGLITHSPYAQGGIATDPKTSKRGGPVNSPRLLVGEEPRHGETVISHNPAYRSDNLSYLVSAARKLGVPMARKGKGAKVPKRLRGGGDPEKIPAVKRYGRLQQQEQDKTRQISIEESKIKEPPTFIKEKGVDENGEMTYEVDWTIVKNYKDAMERVKALYNELIAHMTRMKEGAEEAYAGIAAYISNRQNSIRELKHTVKINKKLLKSKDKDVRQQAKRRIEKAERYIEGQQTKIGSAGEARQSIKEDQHDARFREQEYVVSRDSLQEDINAVDVRANEEATSANPSAESSSASEPGLSYKEQLPLVDTALAQIARDFGSNFNPNVGNLATSPARPTPGVLGGMQDNPAAASSAGGLGAVGAALAGGRQATAALGTTVQAATKQGVTAGIVKAATMPKVRVGAAGAAGGIVGGMGGAAAPVQKVNNITNNFLRQPEDPLTWSKGVGFEIGESL